MNQGARSFGVFIAVLLLLGALVAGGVGLLKSRNAGFATQSAPSVPAASSNSGAQGDQEQATPESQPEPVQTPQEEPALPPETQSAEVASQPSQPHASETVHVPETGPSLVELTTAIGIMMSLTYFVVSLKRFKVIYRRLVP